MRLALALAIVTVFATPLPAKSSEPYEHGDPIPVWANAWSQATFGHPVVFGGDEATSMEWMMKPYGFKGYSFQKDGVSLYIRLHESSVAPDRAKRFHSYEIYARDSTGAVSFWQGWIDRGDPTTQRFASCNMLLDLTHPLRGKPHGWVEDGCAREVWYSRGQDWQWDIVTIINDAASIPTPGETADTPQSQWHLTGRLGTHRTIYAYWYGDHAVRYTTRNNPSPRGWFCSSVYGQIEDCAVDGALPQYISPSMPSVETAVATYRSYSTLGIQVPN